MNAIIPKDVAVIFLALVAAIAFVKWRDTTTVGCPASVERMINERGAQ